MHKIKSKIDTTHISHCFKYNHPSTYTWENLSGFTSMHPYCRTGMGRNNIDESNDLFKYEKIACQS
jgi:hypothetical protein